MALTIKHGLVQMGDAPSLGNVELEEICQFCRSGASGGIPPGAERGQKFSALAKGQVVEQIRVSETYTTDEQQKRVKIREIEATPTFA